MVAAAVADTERAMRWARDSTPDADAASWKVTVPEYDAEGVVIKRFEVTEQMALTDKLRTAFNPQRSDRSLDPGWYTNLIVDDVLWMSDTPAEVRDLIACDEHMRRHHGGSMLIAGLGLGLVLHRAIARRQMRVIDVVEREDRVLTAVGDHYQALAEEFGCKLRFHVADIHQWRIPRGSTWNIGFFDIWPTIAQEDMPEVKRLRDRFRRRLDAFDAWAQDERIAQARRRRTGTGWY